MRQALPCSVTAVNAASLYMWCLGVASASAPVDVAVLSLRQPARAADTRAAVLPLLPYRQGCGAHHHHHQYGICDVSLCALVPSCQQQLCDVHSPSDLHPFMHVSSCYLQFGFRAADHEWAGLLKSIGCAACTTCVLRPTTLWGCGLLGGLFNGQNPTCRNRTSDLEMSGWRCTSWFATVSRSTS